MEIDAIQKAYRRYARLYDFYFGALFQPGRKAVIERMGCRTGQRILLAYHGLLLDRKYRRHSHTDNRRGSSEPRVSFVEKKILAVFVKRICMSIRQHCYV